MFACLMEMDTAMACLYPVEKDLVYRENLLLKKARRQSRDCRPEQRRCGGPRHTQNQPPRVGRLNVKKIQGICSDW